MKEKLEWKNDKRKVSDLKKWKSNPRQWTEQDIERMSKSIEQFGYTEPILIDINNVIVAGNLRYHVLCLQGKHSTTIDVRVANRKLTQKEFNHYGILDNKIGEGKWDFDALANEFNFEDLLSLGFSEKQLGIDISSPIDMGDTVQRSSEYDFEQEQAKAERERLQKKFDAEKEKIEREAREKLLTDLKTGKEQIPDVIKNRLVKEITIDMIPDKVKKEILGKQIDYSDKNKEIDVNEFSDLMILKLKFEKEIYEKVISKLSKYESNEEGILKLLKI